MTLLPQVTRLIVVVVLMRDIESGCDWLSIRILPRENNPLVHFKVSDGNGIIKCHVDNLECSKEK